MSLQVSTPTNSCNVCKLVGKTSAGRQMRRRPLRRARGRYMRSGAEMVRVVRFCQGRKLSARQAQPMIARTRLTYVTSIVRKLFRSTAFSFLISGCSSTHRFDIKPLRKGAPWMNVLVVDSSWMCSVRSNRSMVYFVCSSCPYLWPNQLIRLSL